MKLIYLLAVTAILYVVNGNPLIRGDRTDGGSSTNIAEENLAKVMGHDNEKEKVLDEISATATMCCDQLKDLQLQMQSLIFQDASSDRLKNIKNIVDEIENQTLKFQKMNVELNYVHNSFVEGMMPSNLTIEDESTIYALPQCKKYQKKLFYFCENVEHLLSNCDLLKRKSMFQNLDISPPNKPYELNTLLPCRDKFPQINISMVSQTGNSFTLNVKVNEVLLCLMRFEGPELINVLIKGPNESFGDNFTAGPEASIESKNKIDHFSASKILLFRELTLDAYSVLSHLKANFFRPQDRSLRFFEWLNSLCVLHSQPCFVCGRILSSNHLPAFRRDFSDFSRVLHDSC